MLTNPAIFRTVCLAGETWYNTTVEKSAQAPAKTSRSNVAATNVRSSELCFSSFVRNISTEVCH